jgi:transposase
MEISQKQCQREVIYHYWNQGIHAARVIQQKTGIGLSTIYYNLKKLKKTGSVAQKKGQGRPKKITNSDACIIGQCIRRNPKTSVSDLVNKLAEKGTKVGRETIRTHLHTFGYRNAVPLATPMLTTKHKEKRVEWAQKHLNDNWKKTLFTDETSFQLFRNTITQWYKNKRPIRPIPKNRQKIHAWGDFSMGEKLVFIVLQELWMRIFILKYLEINFLKLKKC